MTAIKPGGNLKGKTMERSEPSAGGAAAQSVPADDGLTRRALRSLQNLPLFAGLPLEFLEDLLGEARLIRVGRSATLFIQDDPADRFYVLLRGWVRLSRIDHGGAETVVRIVAPGESFAEAAMFANGRFPVCGQVAEDAELVVIHARSVLDRLRADPELVLRMLAMLSARMRYLVSRLDRMQTVSARRRLAEFLLRVAGPTDDGAATIRLPYEKALVAAHLSMKPETLSRSFARLRPLGVSTRGGMVLITDLAALRRYVGHERLQAIAGCHPEIMGCGRSPARCRPVQGEVARTPMGLRDSCNPGST